MTGYDLNEDLLSSNDIKIRNIVAKLDMGLELDLSYLSTQIPNSSYKPERYPSLIFRPEDLPTILITNSGILLFTGGKSEKSIREAHRCVTRELNNIGIKVVGSADEIQIVNIVSTFEFSSQINLVHLSIKLGLEKIEYEPEQFPGLIFRIEDGPVALIFSSGKVVITGSVVTSEIISAVNTIRDLISNAHKSSQ